MDEPDQSNLNIYNEEVPDEEEPKMEIDRIVEEENSSDHENSFDDFPFTSDSELTVSLLQQEKKKERVNQQILLQTDIVDQVIRDSRGKEFRNREFKINHLNYTIRDILSGNRVIINVDKLHQPVNAQAGWIQIVLRRTEDPDYVKTMQLPLHNRCKELKSKLEFFTLGKSSFAIARKQVQDEIMDFYLEINQASVQEENMAPMHLIVYYGMLRMTQNFDKDGFHEMFRKEKQYLLSQKALSQIFQKSTFQFAPRFGIMDISTDHFSNHVCIGVGPILQISSYIHVEMKKGNCFLLGTNVEIRVKEVNPKFKHFISSQSPKNVSESNHTKLIYNVLKNIKAQTQITFVGVYPGLAELFDDIGFKIYSENDYMERLAEQSGVLQNKLNSILECGYLQLELKCEDTQQVKNYIVIKDDNNSYSVGRDTSNRIVINVISVSRFHCTIKYSGSSWYIYDGVLDGDEIRNSKYGTWKRVNDQNIHYIEQNQEVRIGLTKLTFIFPEGY